MPRKKVDPFSSLITKVGKTDLKSQKVVSIIDLIESEWGFNFSLYPVQRFLLKIYYGLPLDKKNRNIRITDWRRNLVGVFTEWEYLQYMHDQGRCSIGQKQYEEGKEFQELVLSIGRRSGKTLITSGIAGYETYRLLMKGDPQKYYGMPPSTAIGMLAIATDKTQASLLYNNVSSFYLNCSFFHQYMSNLTQSFARFQTPKDIEVFGSFMDNEKAKASLEITFKSCIAKGLRGGANIVIALDEVAHFTEENSSQSSAEAIWTAVRPSASTFTRKDDQKNPIGDLEAKIILLSSPLGKTGLFYEMFQLGMKGGAAGKNTLSIQAPTWEVNPTIPASEFESNYAKNPQTFYVEYGAEFSDKTRAWIEKEDDLLECVDPTRVIQQSAPAKKPHLMALDFALQGDGSAAAIGHVENGVLVVDYVDWIQAGSGKFKGLDRLNHEDVVDWVYDLSRKFYIKEGVFDQWAGLIFEQLLHKKGLKQIKSLAFTEVLNSRVAKNFLDLVWEKKISLYKPQKKEGEETYIEEILNLQAEYKRDYHIKVEAPNGGHDDRSDALLRMAWIATPYLGNKTSVMRSHNTHSQGLPIASSFLKSYRSGSDTKRMIPRPIRGRTFGR